MTWSRRCRRVPVSAGVNYSFFVYSFVVLSVLAEDFGIKVYVFKNLKANVCGNPGRGRPRRTNIDFIGEVLQEGQVRSTRNRRACMIRSK